MARSAMIEAVAQLAQGLELLADLPAGDERDHLELDVQVALGAAIAATKGFAALEVGRAYERARELCRQRADHPELPAVLSGLCVHHLHRSGVHVAYDVAEELLRTRGTAETSSCRRASVLVVSALTATSSSHSRLRAGARVCDQADRRSPVFLSVSDIRVASLNFIPLILLWRGRNDQAIGAARGHRGRGAGDAYTQSSSSELLAQSASRHSTTVRERRRHKATAGTVFGLGTFAAFFLAGLAAGW
jgi:hypothetical protein